MVPGLCSLCFIKRCRGPCLRLPQESCGTGEPRFRSQIKKTSLGEPVTEGESLRANLSTPVRIVLASAWFYSSVLRVYCFYRTASWTLKL